MSKMLCPNCKEKEADLAEEPVGGFIAVKCPKCGYHSGWAKDKGAAFVSYYNQMAGAEEFFQALPLQVMEIAQGVKELNDMSLNRADDIPQDFALQVGQIFKMISDWFIGRFPYAFVGKAHAIEYSLIDESVRRQNEEMGLQVKLTFDRNLSTSFIMRHDDNPDRLYTHGHAVLFIRPEDEEKEDENEDD